MPLFGKHLLLVAAISICTITSVWAAATLEDGYDAFERGDVDTAVAIWSELAAGGNATAQLNMGQLYRLGKGVEQNDEEAVKWYIMAARNGSEIAAVTLVQMEQDGRASKMDVALALPDEQGTAEDSLAQMSGTQQPEPKPGPQPVPFGTLASAVQSGGAHQHVPIENLDEEPLPQQPQQPQQPSAVPKSVQAQATAPKSSTLPTPAADNQPQPATAPAPALAAKPSSSRAAAVRAGWGATLPKGSYVIQLLQSADTAPLQGYIRSRLSRLDVRPHIVETWRGGRTEYLLLLGPYASQGRANNAISELPELVRDGMPWAGGQPWVRTSSSIHKILPGP